MATAAPRPLTASDVKRSRRRRRALRAPYFFVAPAALLYVAFMLVPIVYALWLSFRGYRVQGGGILAARRQVFVGLSNYTDAVTDPDFLAGFGRLALYGLIAIPLTLGLALVFALLLDTYRVRARRFSRVAIFIPYAVPGVVASLMWGFLYLPGTSPFSHITRALGLGTIPFLDDPQVFFSIANIAIWGGIGFNMVVIYTALRGLPAEVYEAARLDGASEWQIAWRIKIPLVAPALVLTGLFSLIGTLQVYGEPTTLQPMTTSISATWVPLMTVYRDGFTRDNLPLASAESVLLALFTVVLSVALLRSTQRKAFQEEQ
ncbi:carbohydrate ABC transporter permease [Streptomyces sp. NPDC003247]|uniref:carbohydrate ABC transporter permease n=1 Tax=Streptomyces sp. NPDC003247 TaxID=3364677 RepID=UPI00369034C4